MLGVGRLQFGELEYKEEGGGVQTVYVRTPFGGLLAFSDGAGVSVRKQHYGHGAVPWGRRLSVDRSIHHNADYNSADPGKAS
jgi:hypothetical protein